MNNNNQKILIVEDEVLIAEYVKDILEEENFKNIKLAYEAEEALTSIQSFEPDVILMDINLNGVNSGIELARQKNKNASIIFLTGQHDLDLMNQALSTIPDSYLTKPIKKNDLLAAIQLTVLKNRTNIFSFKSGHKEISIPFADILYFKAEGNYIDIFTKDKKYTIRQSLSKCIEELPSHTPFMQTHRSFLVNTNHITKKISNTVYLDSIEIPLSRSYAKGIK